jgi:hypothetical protein
LAPLEPRVGSTVHTDPFQLSANDPTSRNGFPTLTGPLSSTPTAMHDAADTHETLVSALSASPVGPNVVCVVQLAPFAGAASAATEATIAARKPITLIASDPCAIGNASQTLPTAQSLEPGQRR